VNHYCLCEFDLCVPVRRRQGNERRGCAEQGPMGSRLLGNSIPRTQLRPPPEGGTADRASGFAILVVQVPTLQFDKTKIGSGRGASQSINSAVQRGGASRQEAENLLPAERDERIFVTVPGTTCCLTSKTSNDERSGRAVSDDVENAVKLEASPVRSYLAQKSPSREIGTEWGRKNPVRTLALAILMMCRRAVRYRHASLRGRALVFCTMGECARSWVGDEPSVGITGSTTWYSLDRVPGTTVPGTSCSANTTAKYLYLLPVCTRYLVVRYVPVER
jgi:hypothetical protein